MEFQKQASGAKLTALNPHFFRSFEFNCTLLGHDCISLVLRTFGLMTTSQTEHETDTSILPMWTKFLPWIILIATCIACFFVVQKGCTQRPSQEIHSTEDNISGAATYASKGIYELETALEHSNTENIEFVLDGITFVQGSGLIDATSMPALEQLFSVMTKYQSLHIRLEGYCVQQQDTKANLRVSHLRASAIANYLKGKGIDEGRLRTVGRGESNRSTPGASTQSQAYNELVGLIVERL